MKPHDCTGLNDAQCHHADHFFLRLAHWRDGRGLGDQMCIRIARGDAQRKYPLDDSERLVMDVYLCERLEVRAGMPQQQGVPFAQLQIESVAW